MSDPTAPISTVVSKLGERPLVLASVVTNLLLLGFLYYSAIEANAERKHDTELLYDNRKFVGDLLSRCTLQPEKDK
jgi:hypothetical protein